MQTPYSLHSIRLLLGLLVLPFALQFTACSSKEQPSDGTVTGPLPVNVPKWNCLAKMTASSADIKMLPKPVYVFPALRLGPTGQPLDALQPQYNAKGEVYWTTPAPQAQEMKAVIEQRLAAMGFSILTFHEMTEQNREHNILVINPYFSEARDYGAESAGSPTGWTVFTRILGATFPSDLNPTGKRDLFNIEGVSLFTERENATSVVKRVLRYSLAYMGTQKEWVETLSLLD